MFKLLKKLFTHPTEAEMFQKGRKCADQMMAKAQDKQLEANRLFAMADGAFNENALEEAYDNGVKTRLYEMGYSEEV